MVKDAWCGDVWNGGIWSGVTECDDGKVNVDDGGEVNGDEGATVWLQHVWVVWVSEGSGQKEWNDEFVAVEGEMEGQQGPKGKVALERWEEDGMEQEWEEVQVPEVDDASTPCRQKESEKRPLRDPTVEVQEATESEQPV
eukprot:s944_g14.t1